MYSRLIYVRRSWRKIDYAKPMDPDLFLQLSREGQPSKFELQAQGMLQAAECLEYYNAKHPGSEYVIASGKMTQFVATNSSGLWIHGNFVARERKAWCFSFLYLYGPRTLFFFELGNSPCDDGIVTCKPLDGPVNEVHSFLGFPLWWAKRRSGICIPLSLHFNHDACIFLSIFFFHCC